MNRCVLLLLVLLLTACATSPPVQIQRISPEALERLLPQPVTNLTTDDLLRLTREGATPEAIIEQIRQSNSSYVLAPSQIIALSREGLDVRVLDYMQSAREQAVRDGLVEEINRREREHQVELQTLQRQLLLCSSRYDPFCGPYPPYWPYYRR